MDADNVRVEIDAVSELWLLNFEKDIACGNGINCVAIAGVSKQSEFLIHGFVSEGLLGQSDFSLIFQDFRSSNIITWCDSIILEQSCIVGEKRWTKVDTGDNILSVILHRYQFNDSKSGEDVLDISTQGGLFIVNGLSNWLNSPL